MTEAGLIPSIDSVINFAAEHSVGIVQEKTSASPVDPELKKINTDIAILEW